MNIKDKYKIQGSGFQEEGGTIRGKGGHDLRNETDIRVL